MTLLGFVLWNGLFRFILLYFIFHCGLARGRALCFSSVFHSSVFVSTAILLGSIKVPYKEIKRRILACDQENLTAGILEQLIKNMPDADQMNQLAAMKDQYDELAEPEQFAIVVSDRLSIMMMIAVISIALF